MVPRSGFALVVLSIPSLATIAGAQTWQELSTTVPTTALVHDLARDRLLLVGVDGDQRVFELDGAEPKERLGELLGQQTVQHLCWDDGARRVLALSTDRWIGSWSGGSWQWARGGDMPPPAAVVSVAFDELRRRLVVLTGDGIGGTVHEWDGTRWWAVGASLPVPLRAGDAFAYDPVSQRCLALGRTPPETWAWDGFAWSQLASGGPTETAAMAFDAQRRRLVLYASSAVAASTWSWNGTAWVQEATVGDPDPQPGPRLVADGRGVTLAATSLAGTEISTLRGTTWTRTARIGGKPTARTNTAFAHDRMRNQIVGFGGDVGGLTVPPDLTMIFDRRWRWARSATIPPPRHSAHLAWSVVDQRVLLFGGVYQGTTLRNDTWTWSGTDWERRQPAQSPPARHSGVLAPDPSGGVMLFGGTTGPTFIGDHWHWDGTTWQQIAPPVLPAARAFCAFAADPVLGQVVMTGGHSTAASFGGETWWWDGVRWTRSVSTVDPAAPAAFWPGGGVILAANATTAHVWSGSEWIERSGLAAAPLLAPRRYGAVEHLARGSVVQIALPRASELATVRGDVLAFGTPCAFGAPPALTVVGTPCTGESFAIELTARAPSTAALLGLGFVPAGQSIGNGCRWHVGGQIGALFALTDAAGLARAPFAVPANAALHGLAFVTQGAAIDAPRSPLGFATLTSALLVTIGG